MKQEYPRRRWSDRRKIDLLDPYERQYWTKFFGVGEDELLEAIDSVGTRAEDVRHFLASGHQRDWIFGGRENRRQVPGRSAG